MPPGRPISRCLTLRRAQLASSDRVVNDARGEGEDMGRQIQQLKAIVSSDTMFEGVEFKENSVPDAGLMAFRKNVALQLKSSF